MTPMKKRCAALLGGVLLLMLLLLLPSCGEQKTEQPYDCLVTFNYNIGSLDVTCPDQYLGVKAGSVVGIQPGFNDDFPLNHVDGYYVEGWYTAQTQADGTPATDAQTGQVLLGRKWNFETDSVSADTVLYANLIRQSTLSFVDIGTGDVIKTLTGTPGGQQSELISVLAPKKDGYTLVGYYADAEKTTRFQWPFTYAEGDKVVYVEFIEGVWTIADSAETFMRGIAGNKDIYVTADIDFSEANWVTTSYNGTLQGNGHKLTGLTLRKEGNKNVTSGFGLFTVLGAKAHISNLTLEDVRMTFTAALGGAYDVAPLADEIKAGARLDSVTMTGSLTYDIERAPASTVYPIAVRNGITEGDMAGCVFDVALIDANEQKQ